MLEKEVESYDLTIKHIRPDGRGTDFNQTTVTGIDNPAGVWVETDVNGTAKVRLPKGKYFVDGALYDDDARLYQLIWPTLVLDRATTAAVDARRAKPVKMTLPKADVKLARVEFGYLRQTEEFGAAGSIYANDLGRIFVGTVGPPAPESEMFSYVYSRWGVPGKDREFRNTPYSYDLLKGKRGSYFNGYSRVVKERELAKVVGQYNADQPGDIADAAQYGMLPEMQGSSAGAPFRHDLPARTVQYLDAANTTWAATFDTVRITGEGEQSPLGLTQIDKVYKPGKAYAERWAATVAAPGLADGDGSFRTGNEMQIFMFPASDPDGHNGTSISFDSAVTKLYSDGKLVASEDWPGQLFAENLPGAKASYRLETSQARSLLQLAPYMESVWTFSSQDAGDRKEVLPLRAVQFLPAVDSRNAVARKPVSKLPFKVVHQPGAKVSPVKKVEVQVSGDGGVTWRKTVVVPTANGSYDAIFPTPQGAKLISLKSLVTDKAGNTSASTVTNAYRIR